MLSRTTPSRQKVFNHQEFYSSLPINPLWWFTLPSGTKNWYKILSHLYFISPLKWIKIMAKFCTIEIDQVRSYITPSLFIGAYIVHNLCRYSWRIKVMSYGILLEQVIRFQRKSSKKRKEKTWLQGMRKSNEEKVKAQNHRALKLCLWSIEFNRECACATTKQILDTLATTYEWISHVREAKISVCVGKYKLFKCCQLNIWKRYPRDSQSLSKIINL